MNRRVKFIGIVGLVAICFGLLILGLANQNIYNIVYIQFVVGTVFCLIFLFKGGVAYLGSAASKRASRFSFNILGYTLLFLGAVVAINYASFRNQFFYFDGTEEKFYTLSPESIKFLEKLDKKIQVYCFYVNGMVAPEAEVFFDRFSRQSKGKLDFKIIDPDKFPALVAKYEVQTADTLVFTFAGEEDGRQSRVSDKDLTEESIINTLLMLTRGEEMKAYYLRGHGEPELYMKDALGYSLLREAVSGENVKLNELYLKEGEKIPEDAKALIINAPKRALLTWELEQVIDFFNKGGGGVILSEFESESNLSVITEMLGVEIGKDIIVDEVLSSQGGMGVQPVVSLYGTHPIVNEFRENTLFVGVSSVRQKSEQSVFHRTIVPFAYSSKSSWAEKNTALIFSDNPQAGYEPEDIKGPVPIAVAVDGILDVQKEKEADSVDTRIVIYGDSDFVNNSNIFKLFNRDLFLNSFNWVLGETERVTIRAKTLKRTMTNLTEEQFGMSFLFTVLLLPEFLVLTGLGVWWFRKS